ncbi:MAG: SMI1/KNR4 family protein [Actinomycetota bacterium]
MLTLDLLEELKTGWARQRAPVVDHLRPGLSPERIDELTAPLGLRLPVEARTWWEWHDGVDVTLGIHSELGPSVPFLPLGNAAELCRLLREQAGKTWGDQADHWWRPGWFPITERSRGDQMGLRVEEGAPTPIFWADSHDYDADGLANPKVDSFGTMVTWWIEALDSGAWRYDAGAGRWERRSELLPSEREVSRLV